MFYCLPLVEVVESELTQPVESSPVVLEALCIVLACRLPVVLCKREVVDGGLSLNKPCEHGVVCFLGYVERLA